MQFGGWSQFGGGAQFGGAESRTVQYYRILKSLRPPGVYAESDDELSALMLRAYAHGLSDHIKAHVEHLAEEIFPQHADALLTEWESTLKIVPPNGATLETRRAACLAKWRGGVSSSCKNLRAMLAPVLNPTIMFWDRCDDENVSFRFLQLLGNGAVNEDDTALTLSAESGVDAEWTTTTCNAMRLLVPWNDRADDMHVEVKSDGIIPITGVWGGAVLYENENSALIVRHRCTTGCEPPEYAEPVYIVEALRISSGSVLTLAIVPVADAGAWIGVRRVNGIYEFTQGTTRAGMAVFVSSSVGGITPRYGGVCAGGPIATAPVFMVGDIILRQGLPENNVELIEMPKTNVSALQPEAKLFAFVHRDPEDAGYYDIKQAQRLMDAAKQGHTLILVGESDCFRCDDPYSLTDRDILGS